ncbi:hypothetical protein K6Y82_51245, partial [Burkholderia cenocepacia]
ALAAARALARGSEGSASPRHRFARARSATTCTTPSCRATRAIGQASGSTAKRTHWRTLALAEARERARETAAPHASCAQDALLRADVLTDLRLEVRDVGTPRAGSMAARDAAERSRAGLGGGLVVAEVDGDGSWRSHAPTPSVSGLERRGLAPQP